jgi:hypothetical protein
MPTTTREEIKNIAESPFFSPKEKFSLASKTHNRPKTAAMRASLTPRDNINELPEEF